MQSLVNGHQSELVEAYYFCTRIYGNDIYST